MYTAGVGYGVSRVTVTVTKNDPAATVAYLDASDLPLTDADTADGQQVDLSVGENVVKAKVTAADTTTTETYVVTITRTGQDTSLSATASDPAAAFVSTATYAVTFRGAWTNTVTPGGVPAGAHFSRLIGGVHNSAVSFLESGETSSAGVEAMAEVGGWTDLRDEVVAAEPDALSTLIGDTDSISATSSKSLTATLTTEHPRVTLVTMIAPSHDWFVGVSGLPLLDSEGRWLRSHEVNLYPWDAGTEEGTDFSLSPSVATSPLGVIESIRGTGLFTTEPIATLSFELESVATTRTVAENTATGTGIGAPVAVTDTSGTVTYALSGTDASSFDIDASTGQLQTKAALDYETQPSYEVTVTATDSDGATSIVVTIEVANVAELHSAVTGPASVTHPENGPGRAASYTASSPQDRDGIVWSLSGDDAAHFSIDDPGGALRFHIDPVSPNLFPKPPDYESPADTDLDNEYTVTVTASMAGSSTSVTKDVSVTVTDADEAGTLILSSTRPRLGTAVTTTLSDPEGVTGTPVYAWERSIRPNAWAVIAGATSSTYTPTAADTGTFLRVTATYEDGQGTGKSAAALTYEVVTASLLSGLSVSTNDSSANPARALSPAFGADILHYAIGCTEAGDTMTVTPTAASGVRLAVNGVQTASGTGTAVTVAAESDVHIALSGADGAATTYVVHCLIPELWLMEAAKTSGATGILEDLILLKLGDHTSTVAMLDNNAVPRFHRDVGHPVWVYFRVGRVDVADQQQGHEPEYRYAYIKNITGAREWVILNQDLESFDTATTEAPLVTTDVHDLRILENGNYLLMAYEPAERDLSDLPFDHPDVDAVQPQTIKDSALQIVTAAGQALFTWNTWGNMPLEDCSQERFPDGYAHLNSLQMLDGLIFASFRGCSQVLAIDPDHTENHKVVWRLGRTNLTAAQWEERNIGPAPMDIFGDPAGQFCGEHAAQVLPNGNLMLFDNGTACLMNPWTGEAVGRVSGEYSRAVEYALDLENREAVFLRDHSLRGADQYLGYFHGQVEPLDNGDWLVSWGRPHPRNATPDSLPVEAVTQVDPDTGEEKFSLRDPDHPRLHVRAIPLHPVALFAEPQLLAAEFPASSHTSLASLGPADRPKVVVAFNQPVVDPAAATASVSVVGATVTSVSPHRVHGEVANAYIFTLTPAGYGAITFGLVESQACGSGGVCTADGRTLSEVPASYVIAGTPQFSADESGTRSVDENTPSGRSIGDPVAATDPDGASLTYTLDGVDGSSFGIVTGTGQLRTLALLDYEARDRYMVTVTATNPSGVSGTTTVVIEVDDVNEAPVVSGSTVLSIEENASRALGVFEADDPDSGDTATWSLSGPGSDEDLFSIDGGVLRFLAPPDFEARSDSQGRHVYGLVVQVADDELTGTLDVQVNVTNVNEAPEIDGPGTADFAEGRSGVIAAYTAVEPEGESVGWSLLGDDMGAFDVVDGRLSFKSPPDFEARADADGDSVYEVVVVASDGQLTATLPVAVRVGNEEEPGTVSLSAVQPQEGESLGAELSDPDEVVVSSVSWQWQASPDKVSWSPIDGEVSREYTPAASDVGRYLRAQASYRDGHGSDKQALAESQHRVIAAPVMNQSPAFAGGGTVTRRVAEEAAVGSQVGDAVTATDPEGDTLTYSIDSPDGTPFEIVPATGQLLTTAVLDHETAGSHTLTVTAADPSGAATTTQVEVEVWDANEAPEVSGVQIASYEENGTGDVATFTASDPDDGDSVSWELDGPDRRWFSIDGGVLRFETPPDHDRPADRGADNGYDIVVTAVDSGGLEGTLDVAVNVAGVNEPPLLVGPDTVSVPQQRRAVASYTATDPEKVTVSWSLDGADEHLFSIDGGALRFTSPPDLDAPADSDGDNDYQVTVEAADGIHTSHLDVTVTVTAASAQRPQPVSSRSPSGARGGGVDGVEGTTLFIANGWSPADVGVAAAFAARTHGSAVVYTEGDELPSAVTSLLGARTVHLIVLIGGEAAISVDVSASLATAEPFADIKRVAGSTRTDTAAHAARLALEAASGQRATLIIANGWSPPDIGTAAMLAARLEHSAVIYTQAGELPEESRQLIADMSPRSIVIVGGTAAVSQAVEDEIRETAAGASLERISGASRSHTAQLAARYLDQRSSPVPAGERVVIVANGWSPPDIGIAAALSARTPGALIAYTAPDTLPTETQELLRTTQPGLVRIIGGTDAVPSPVQSEITAVLPAGAQTRRTSGQSRIHTSVNVARSILPRG